MLVCHNLYTTKRLYNHRNNHIESWIDKAYISFYEVNIFKYFNQEMAIYNYKAFHNFLLFIIIFTIFYIIYYIRLIQMINRLNPFIYADMRVNESRINTDHRDKFLQTIWPEDFNEIKAQRAMATSHSAATLNSANGEYQIYLDAISKTQNSCNLYIQFLENNNYVITISEESAFTVFFQLKYCDNKISFGYMNIFNFLDENKNIAELKDKLKILYFSQIEIFINQNLSKNDFLIIMNALYDDTKRVLRTPYILNSLTEKQKQAFLDYESIFKTMLKLNFIKEITQVKSFWDKAFKEKIKKNKKNKESLRLHKESSRLSKESSRLSKESSRLSKESSRLSKESSRSSKESSGFSKESSRLSNITQSTNDPLNNSSRSTLET
jgi:hypothetical protein